MKKKKNSNQLNEPVNFSTLDAYNHQSRIHLPAASISEAVIMEPTQNIEPMQRTTTTQSLLENTLGIVLP